MKIGVSETDIDNEFRYFLAMHRNGIEQEAKAVAACIQKSLYRRGYEVAHEYLESRWLELLKEPEAEKPRKLSNYLLDKMERKMEIWKIAKRSAVKYMKTLPKVDEELRKRLDRNVAGAFTYNGRAFDIELDKEARKIFVGLEKEAA